MSLQLFAANLLVEKGLQGVKIQRPANIVTLCGTDTTQSPRAQNLAIRNLKIFENSITPVHVHHKKEKTYIRLNETSGAKAIVFMFIKGRWESFELLTGGHPVAVPPGTMHALYTSAFIDLLVITSNQDAEDIEWEEDEQ